MISKNLDLLKRIENEINIINNDDLRHPLTCVNNRVNCDLKTEINLVNDVSGDYQLNLVCCDCGYRQDVPQFIIDIVNNK